MEQVGILVPFQIFLDNMQTVRWRYIKVWGKTTYFALVLQSLYVSGERYCILVFSNVYCVFSNSIALYPIVTFRSCLLAYYYIYNDTFELLRFTQYLTVIIFGNSRLLHSLKIRKKYIRNAVEYIYFWSNEIKLNNDNEKAREMDSWG